MEEVREPVYGEEPSTQVRLPALDYTEFVKPMRAADRGMMMVATYWLRYGRFASLRSECD